MEDADHIVDLSHELISSARVEGTPVYDPTGTKLGTIHSVMIHKRSGQVAYAVLSFGGFLGIGGHVYPIPWEKLVYAENRHGYIAQDVTAETIRSAPSMNLDSTDRPREMEGEMYAYWDVNPYW
jgi:sporulation protein YlmC with PRC-barrel domain